MRRPPVLAMTIIIGLTPCGCRQAEPRPEGQASDPPPTDPRPSIWRDVGGSQQAAITDEQLGAALAEASEEARRTADEARQRWEAADREARARWGVKWAAPTGDGGVEYLWVEPVSWSPFRIEGILANRPQGDLEGGQQMGQLVSFPLEQLADWMYLPTGDVDGPRQGGFTIDVLDKAGTPGAGG